MKRYMRRVGREWVGDRKRFIRWQLPYGCYHCADGREVLFDRDYAPICERFPGKPPRMADPKERIRDIVRQEWFYNDGTPEPQKTGAAEAKLVEWSMLDPVMAQIEEAVRNCEYFSWPHRTWRQSRKRAA